MIRALEDEAADRPISSEAVGRAWLNYIIENRTVFWWGGYGNSAAHTAYIRLKQGMKPPLTGAESTNGQEMSERIAG